MKGQGETLEIRDMGIEELIKILCHAAASFRFVVLYNPREFVQDWELHPRELMRYLQVIERGGLPHRGQTLFGYTHLRVASMTETLDIEARLTEKEMKRSLERFIEAQPEAQRAALRDALS